MINVVFVLSVFGSKGSDFYSTVLYTEKVFRRLRHGDDEKYMLLKMIIAKC